MEHLSYDSAFYGRSDSAIEAPFRGIFGSWEASARARGCLVSNKTVSALTLNSVDDTDFWHLRVVMNSDLRGCWREKGQPDQAGPQCWIGWGDWAVLVLFRGGAGGDAADFGGAGFGVGGCA